MQAVVSPLMKKDGRLFSGGWRLRARARAFIHAGCARESTRMCGKASWSPSSRKGRRADADSPFPFFSFFPQCVRLFVRCSILQRGKAPRTLNIPPVKEAFGAGGRSPFPLCASRQKPGDSPARSLLDRPAARYVTPVLAAREVAGGGGEQREVGQCQNRAGYKSVRRDRALLGGA